MRPVALAALALLLLVVPARALNEWTVAVYQSVDDTDPAIEEAVIPDTKEMAEAGAATGIAVVI